MGTPGFAPIEQSNCKQSKPPRPTLDVYALGATFLKLLTGEIPPSAPDIVEDEDSLNKIVRQVNPQLQDIIVKAMQPSAKRRMASVADFIASIMPYCDTVSSERKDLTVIDGASSDTVNPLIEEEGGTDIPLLIIDTEESDDKQSHTDGCP